MVRKFLPLVAWNAIELPKGLAVGNLVHRNLALLFKWLQRYFSEPNSIWRNVIQCKYNYTSHFTPSESQVPKFGGPWKNLCTAVLNNLTTKPLAHSGIRNKVGNGAVSNLGPTFGLVTLPSKTFFLDYILLSSHQQASISSLGFQKGSFWQWSLSWYRTLQVHDLIELESLQKMLQDVYIVSHDPPDECIWSLNKDGIFSVKLLSFELAKSSNLMQYVMTKNLWRGPFPPHIEVFFSCLSRKN